MLLRGQGQGMEVVIGALVGILIGKTVRLRSHLAVDGLAFPMLIVGTLLVLTSSHPIVVVTALLVATYTGALLHRRVPR